MANEETALAEWSGPKNPTKGPQPPRLSLRESVDIVTAIYERAGGEASADTLSEILGNTRKSSGYALKLSALKKYDLIVSDDEKTSLSDAAESIVAPRDVSQRMQAIKYSFLRIEAFKNVYERYIGKILPQDEFLSRGSVGLTILV